MTKLNFTRLSHLSLLLLALVFTSCNDDFSEVGSSLVDNNNFDALLYETNNLTAKSTKIERAQTNQLPVYQLGSYQDPIYGKTDANLLTQISLSNPDPQFQESAELDSVILNIPYFSTITEQTADGRTYKLDSVFGDGRIDFSIFRSNYFLRPFDPNDDFNSQAYYSDQTALFESNLDPAPIYQVQNFKPIAQQLTVITPSGSSADTSKVSPRLRVALPTDYFNDLILENTGTNVLISNSNFQDFFRGLYFKVDGADNGGVLSYLNFTSDEAKITLYYNYDFTDVSGEDSKLNSTYDLNFGPNTVNTFESEYTTLPDQENLYLKGNAGSMAVINLFPDQSELDSIRELDWLVNEANLRFYVNESALPENYDQPERIFIYSLENGLPLSDYQFASDILQNNIVNSRRVHLGRLTEDDNGDSYYKIRITNYMNNLVSSESTDTKLGLTVSQNVNIPNTVKAEAGTDSVSEIPVASVVSPEGTILYGTQAPIESKRLQLDIYYTETN